MERVKQHTMTVRKHDKHTETPMTQPNILFLYSDQHRYDCLGGNGHPQLATPYLDRLAGEGTSFTHAFCPAPICVPTRCSLLTGAWPWRHGTVMNFDSESYRPLSKTPAMYPLLLRRQGYCTAHVGRWHVEPGSSPLQFGYDEHVSDTEYVGWRDRQGLPPRPETGWFGGTDADITSDQSFLKWEADQTIGLIRKAGREDRPFLIEWHTVAPHLPNIVPEPFASMYPPDQIAPWPGFHDALEGKPYIQAQQRRTWQVDGWSWRDWAPVVSRYLGEISLYDQQIGRVLGVLDELGLRDNTLVVYTSDHGDLCGSHGMIDKQYVMYDDVVRVPMMARFPGVVPAGYTCNAFVCNSIDLAYTFVALAGAAPPQSFAGRNILQIVDGNDQAPREDIYSIFVGNQFGLFSQRMVRNRQWKYVWNATAEDELYDLENDPAEIRNLARQAAHGETLRHLRCRLVEWMRQTGDKLLNQWTERQLLEGLKI